MDREKLLKQSLVYQHDHKDCGAACLLMAIRWYGYQDSLEHLRTLTGTNKEGVTLLGLQHAANKLGFEAEAFKASLEDLSGIEGPMILHVLKHGSFNHFVLCLGRKKGGWLIADPEDGIGIYNDEELLALWQSGVFLRLNLTKPLNLPKRKGGIFRHWFLPLLGAYRKQLLLIFGLGIIHAVLLFSTSVFTERLVDELLPSQDKSLVLGGLLLWSIFLICSLAVSFIRSYRVAVFSRAFNLNLVKSFFGKLLYLPKPFFDSKKTGDLMTRLEDIEGVEESTTQWIEDGLVGVLIVIVAICLLFVYSLKLALISLLLLPTLFLIILALRKRINIAQREAMVSHAMNNANYMDAITGVDVIKARQAELKFSKYALKVYKSFRDKVFIAEKVSINFGTLVQALVFMNTIIIIGVASLNVLSGNLQMGNFLAIISISSIASASTSNLAFAYVDFEQAKISFERMHDLIGQRTEGASAEERIIIQTKNQLKIDNLSFSFPGHPSILDHVSVNLKQGELITLLGESGAGKSTLLSLISTLYQPDAGGIYFNDQDVFKCQLNWRRLIGIVPQDVKVFNASFWENVSIKSIGEENEMARSRVEQLIALHRLESFVNDFHSGVDTLLGENGVRLSGGQKKVLGLLRALYNHPKVLLLDEATASLDRKGRALVTSILQEVKPNMCVLQITHDPIIAQQSDYIYILEQGGTDVHGTPADLLTKENTFSDTFSNIWQAGGLQKEA